MLKFINRCPVDPKKLLNPKTGRCILENSPILKKLLAEGYVVVLTPETQPPPATGTSNMKIFKVCPSDPTKLVNPETNRCVKQTNPTIQKLLKEGWTIAMSDERAGPVIVKPEESVNYDELVYALDKNKDSIISINEYLDDVEITPVEETEKVGKFISLYQADNISEFLRIIVQSEPALAENLCMYFPDYVVKTNPISGSLPVIKTFPTKLSAKKDTNYKTSDNLKTAKLILLERNTIFIYPPDLSKAVSDCEERFLIMPLVLYYLKQQDAQGAHQNILIFDNKDKTIDRFDPHGRTSERYDANEIDNYLTKELRSIVPSYKFIRTELACPYLGPQAVADVSKGYCVTWSIMFTLLRLLNPDKKIGQLVEFMKEGTREELISKLKRFAKYYSDIIKRNT